MGTDVSAADTPEPVVTVRELRVLVASWREQAVRVRAEGPLPAIALDICAHNLTALCDAAERQR